MGHCIYRNSAKGPRDTSFPVSISRLSSSQRTLSISRRVRHRRTLYIASQWLALLIIATLQEYADVQLTAVLASLTKSAVALNDVRPIIFFSPVTSEPQCSYWSCNRLLAITYYLSHRKAATIVFHSVLDHVRENSQEDLEWFVVWAGRSGALRSELSLLDGCIPIVGGLKTHDGCDWALQVAICASQVAEDWTCHWIYTTSYISHGSCSLLCADGVQNFATVILNKLTCVRIKFFQLLQAKSSRYTN